MSDWRKTLRAVRSESIQLLIIVLAVAVGIFVGFLVWGGDVVCSCLCVKELMP